MPSHGLRDVTTPSSKMENLNFRTLRSGPQQSTNYLTSSFVQSLFISYLGVERNLYTEQSAAHKFYISASPKGKIGSAPTVITVKPELYITRVISYMSRSYSSRTQ
jgi:hypothetical protein